MEDTRESSEPSGLGSLVGRPTARRILDETVRILEHTLALVAAILSIWCVHLVLEALLGHDAKFYDWIPVSYIIDTGHLAVLIRFVWKLIQQIWNK